MTFAYFVVEDESGGEDIEDVHHTGLSTSGYAVGKRLLGMGLGGINKEKIDEARKNNTVVKDEAQQKSIPTFEEIVLQKKRKKVYHSYTVNFATQARFQHWKRFFK